MKPARARWHSLAWAWLLVVALVVGHNAWLWLGQRIVPNTDILNLLPAQQRDAAVQASFARMVDAAQQRVIVLVGAPDWAQATKAAGAYRERIRTQPALIELSALDESTQAGWLDAFAAHRLVLLTAAQEQRLRDAPPESWTEDALARLYGTFGGPKLGSFRDDPFGLFGAWMQERAGETPVRPRDGLLFVGDKEREYVVMPMLLKVPAFSLSGQRAVLPLLAQAEREARAAGQGVRVISAGVILHAAAAGEQANREVHTIGLGSLVGIVVLTWLVFRSLRPIALTLLSIGVGFLGAFSVCWLLFGSVHLMTLVFGASLIGVAQDYGIYYLCHRLAADRTLDPQRLMRKLLPGLGLTLLAAVIGYMGLALAPLPGLRHMAVFSALGLLFAWLTVVAWFPALIGPATLREGPLARRYGELLPRWPRFRTSAGWIGLSALAGALIIAGCSRLHANDDIRGLQTSPAHLLRDQIDLSRLLDVASPVQYFVVRGADAEQVLAREEALKARLQGLIDARQIEGVQAISNWVPSQATQQARLALVEQRLLSPAGPLHGLAAAIGEDAGWAAATARHLRGGAQPLTVDAFMRTPAAEPWRHLWLGAVDGQYASVVALRGLGRAAVPAVQAAAQGMPGVQWVDKVAEISGVLGSFRVHMMWVVLGAYGVVLALLYPRFGIANALRVLTPVAASSALALACLGLAGQPLQLFHVLALMLVLGIGVDYGIFLHDRGAGDVRAPWLAVGLSAANTILSFGLLALSGTPALRAFGLVMLIGIGLVWLLAPCFAPRRPPATLHDGQGQQEALQSRRQPQQQGLQGEQTHVA